MKQHHQDKIVKYFDWLLLKLIFHINRNFVQEIVLYKKTELEVKIFN